MPKNGPQMYNRNVLSWATILGKWTGGHSVWGPRLQDTRNLSCGILEPPWKLALLHNLSGKSNGGHVWVWRGSRLPLPFYLLGFSHGLAQWRERTWVPGNRRRARALMSNSTVLSQDEGLHGGHGRLCTHTGVWVWVLSSWFQQTFWGHSDHPVVTVLHLFEKHPAREFSFGHSDF